MVESPVELAPTTGILTGSGTGEVTSPLLSVGLGRLEEFPQAAFHGAIALVHRGEISFRQKVENAVSFGASGVVIFNNAPGLFRGTLVAPFEIPVVSISQFDGETLLGLLQEGKVNVNLRVQPEAKPSRNVVAVKEGGQGAILVLGAHYDSVPASPGANDNASGTSVLLALAEELARLELPIEVRFVAFGSEELGLLGSSHYVETLPREERDLIVGMLNFDALASSGLRIGGNPSLVERALALARVSGFQADATREPPGASSDHAPFRAAGIPVLFFVGADSSRIHSPEDTIELVEPELLGQAGALALDIITSLIPVPGRMRAS